jgi:hypothetical protein
VFPLDKDLHGCRLLGSWNGSLINFRTAHHSGTMRIRHARNLFTPLGNLVSESVEDE